MKRYEKQKTCMAGYVYRAKAKGWDEAFTEYLRAEYTFAKQACKDFKMGRINPLVPPQHVSGLFTPEQNNELVRLWKRIPPEFLITRQRRFFKGESQ